MLPLLMIAATASSSVPWRKVSGPGFQGMRAEVQHLIDDDPEVRGSARVCMVVETGIKGVGPTAWIHIPAAGWLHAFGETRYPPISDVDEWAAASVDLRHDVVATERQVGTSVKRRSRAYVDRIIDACARHGETFTVVKRRG